MFLVGLVYMCCLLLSYYSGLGTLCGYLHSYKVNSGCALHIQVPCHTAVLWKEETSWVLCDHIGTVGGLGYFAVGTTPGKSHYVCPFCCTLCSNHQCDVGCASSHLSYQHLLTALYHICPPLYSCWPVCALQFHGASCSCCAASVVHDHVLWRCCYRYGFCHQHGCKEEQHLFIY